MAGQFSVARHFLKSVLRANPMGLDKYRRTGVPLVLLALLLLFPPVAMAQDNIRLACDARTRFESCRVNRCGLS